MELPVNAAEIFAVYVSVNLRGRDVRVSEHFLDRTEVSTTFEQVCRK
jgi:hypothetical protein